MAGAEMRFNVSQLMKEEGGSSRFFDVDERIFLVDCVDRRRVRGTVKLMKTDRGVWVSAALDSDVACVCSRCLEEYVEPLHVVVEEEFRSRSSGDVWELSVGESGFEGGIDIGNDILDITEAVAHHYELSVPMKPVCRCGCRGICSGCGVDLNQVSCKCDSTERGSQWDILANLRLADKFLKDDKS